MAAKKQSSTKLTLEDKFKILEDLNVFHNNPQSGNSKVTKEYEKKNFYFEIEFNNGVRLYQVDSDKYEIPAEYIWGSPDRKTYIESLHEALDKCIKDHETMNTKEKVKSSKDKKESDKEALSSPEDLELLD